MSAKFEIIGGHKLHGEVIPQGAKNEALQIICCVLLTPEPVTITNIPDIRDVNKLIELINAMGVKVTRNGHGSVTFQADAVNLDYLQTKEFQEKAASLRGSVMIVGPLLARFGTARIPKPGGDKIGRRRLDTHFIGLEKLGARFEYDTETQFYQVSGKNLKGCYHLMDEASVTGTANILMAAVLAEGTTTLYNAACEPYLQQLSAMLIRMGAKIEGHGSNLLRITGVKELGGTEHRMLPDMIELLPDRTEDSHFVPMFGVDFPLKIVLGLEAQEVVPFQLW